MVVDCIDIREKKKKKNKGHLKKNIIESLPRFLTNYPESHTSLSHLLTWSDNVNNVVMLQSDYLPCDRVLCSFTTHFFVSPPPPSPPPCGCVHMVQ